MKKTVLISVVISALTLVLGFVAGTTYQKGKTILGRPDFAQMGENFGDNKQGESKSNANSRDSLMKGNAPVSGKIISMDATSITVQTQDGSNKIVLVSDQTKVNKTTEGARVDLTVGAEVMVIGNTNNGAVTAESISLGTNFMRTQTAPTPSVTAK